MAKFIGWVVIILVVFMSAMYGISVFLSPDDLAECGQSPSSNVEGCKKADVIVAISGGNTAARTNSAIELYKNGWADKIIFSGDSADPNAPSNAEEMRETALRAGVPNKDILLDETSTSTIENAQNVAEILNEKNWDDVILTTSNYHLRRAKTVFESSRDGIYVRTSAADDGVSDDLWWTTPRGWYLAFYELAGLAIFHISEVGR